MKVAITGASGLLGGNLALELLRQGHEVTATRRAGSKVDHLAAHPIRWVEGTLGDVDSLRRAFDGAEVVFHCAAAVTIRMRITPEIRATNVDGTQNVIDAVRACGVRRLVHCSTVGAVGLSTDGEPSDESQTWNLAEDGLDDAYTTTKHLAEMCVMDAAAAGLDAVVVNPSYLIGPLDAKVSSGRLVLSIMRGEIPGYSSGKNNFVDVRDVAWGMVAAAERGRTGERYILAGHNMTYRAFMDTVSEVTGCRRVRWPIARTLARGFGLGGDALQWVTGREQTLNSATIRWGFNSRFIFTSEKARRELGYEISEIGPAIGAAADWFRANLS